MSDAGAHKVLFVDDEPIFAQTYVLGLSVRGIEATLVTSVEKAREAFAQEGFDYRVAILDLWMPGPHDLIGDGNPNGYQTGVLLAKELRKKHATIPIILLSNFSDQIDASQLVGMEDVKICDKTSVPPSQLARLILELLASRNAAPQSKAPPELT